MPELSRDEILTTGMHEVADLITKALRLELIKQGHRATGRLINSIQAYVVSLLDRIEVQVNYLDYGRGVNTGQPPGTMVPLNDLLKWMHAKGIGQGEKTPDFVIAKRIQRAIYREGSPTIGRQAKFPGSAGRLVGFQDYTVDENTGKISDNLIYAAQIFAIQILHDILKEVNPIEIKIPA